MKMPPITAKVCKDEGWDSPPENDESCTVSNYRNDGKKMSWDVDCPQGKGHGEMTLEGNDKFTGFIEFSTEDGDMHMDMSGQKLGACDAATSRTTINGREMPTAAEADAMVQQMDKQRQQNDQLLAKAEGDAKARCTAAVTGMDTMYIRSCPDQVPAFCQRMQTDDGLLSLSLSASNFGLDTDLDNAAELCKTQYDKNQVLARACKEASAKINLKALEYHCPAELQQLQKQHCHLVEIGEGYESQPNEPGYESLCRSAALDPGERSALQTTKDVIQQEGLNAVKGLFKW